MPPQSQNEYMRDSRSLSTFFQLFGLQNNMVSNRRNHNLTASGEGSQTELMAPLRVDDIESQPLQTHVLVPTKILHRNIWRLETEGTEFVEIPFSEDSDSSHSLEASTNLTAPASAVSISSQRQASRLVFGAAGIYGAYLFYGHVQEDLFDYRASDGSSFRSVWLLQTFESLANIVVGIAGRHYFGGRPNLSLRPFFTTGVSQVFAKAMTSLALAAGLSFPVCILAKSAKIVPVMLGQLVIGGSQYGFRDYLFAILVVGGTALLSFGSKKNKGDGSSSTPMGVLFILLSLVCDGLTAGFQKRLKRTYSATPPTTYDFLLYTNLAMGAVALAISMCSSDLMNGLAFLEENPPVASMVAKVCVCSAIGQSFIFFVVATFDPLVCSTITTTRKMLTVLWSVVSKGHVLSGEGTAGLALAMSGLVLEVYGKVMRMSKTTKTGASPTVQGKTGKVAFGATLR